MSTLIGEGLIGSIPSGGTTGRGWLGEGKSCFFRVLATDSLPILQWWFCSHVCAGGIDWIHLVIGVGMKVGGSRGMRAGVGGDMIKIYCQRINQNILK